MNETMLMMARSHESELTQDVAQAKRAARVGRIRPTPRRAQPKTAARAAAPRPRRSASWLAAALAQLRPTIAGR